MLYKEDVLKNILNFTDKLKKQSSKGVLSKDFLKTFQNSQKNIFARISFVIKLQAANSLFGNSLKLSETATGVVQYNKVFLKVSQISQESLFNKVAVLRACNFI